GCAGPVFREPQIEPPPTIALPPTVEPQPAPEPEEVLGSVIYQLLWLIKPLALVVLAIWILAVWKPWLSMRVAWGASLGLGGLIVLAWLVAYLAKYSDWVMIGGGLAALAICVWFYWPLVKALRARRVMRESVRAIERGGHGFDIGMARLAAAGVWAANGGDKVRIGWPVSKRVKIGPSAERLRPDVDVGERP
ncbi:hypothetical protein LCGC14_0878660, partial [marine sediment metagenome]